MRGDRARSAARLIAILENAGTNGAVMTNILPVMGQSKPAVDQLLKFIRNAEVGRRVVVCVQEGRDYIYKIDPYYTPSEWEVWDTRFNRDNRTRRDTESNQAIEHARKFGQPNQEAIERLTRALFDEIDRVRTMA